MRSRPFLSLRKMRMRMSSPSISGALAHVYTLQHYAEGLHFSAFHTNCNALRKLTTVGTYHKGAGGHGQWFMCRH